VFYHSRRLKFIFGLIIKLTALFFTLRLVFIFSFITGMTGSSSELVRAIWVGSRFDLRLAVLINIPIIFAFLIPRWNPLRNLFLQRLSLTYLGIALSALFIFYGFDLGNYSYLAVNPIIFFQLFRSNKDNKLRNEGYGESNFQSPLS